VRSGRRGERVIAAVERLSGRRVIDVISCSNIDADVSSEVFVLGGNP
jgi:hypothetical protein